MYTGIDHATCLATARSTTSRAIRAHYLNLAAYWRLSRGTRRVPRVIGRAVTTSFTPGARGYLPA